MSLGFVAMIAIAVLVLLAFLPSKKGGESSISLPNFNGKVKTSREIEIDEDLEAVGEAYRASEAEARRLAAIEKIAKLAASSQSKGK